MSGAFGVDIAKADLETLTEFQRELHFAAGTVKKQRQVAKQTPQGSINVVEEYEEPEEITSNFLREPRKTTWYSRIQMRLAMTETEDVVTYTANNTLHRLEHVDLIAELPALRVKKEFRETIRICWTHNLLHNIANQASMVKDEDLITSIDSKWMDEYAQHYLKPGTRETYNVGIGNVGFLEKWNEFLPGYLLTAPQPWPISEDMSLSFPLFLLPPTSHLIFRYRPCLEIDKLLRMQRFDKKTGTWRNIKCNLKYVDGVGTLKKLKVPTLRGHYNYMTPEEQGWWTCGDREHVFYINHVVSFNTQNAMEYHQNVPAELTAAGPCRAIHWVAENQNFTNYNNRSNYSTAENIYEGWSPWSTYQLIYGGSSPRTEITPSEVSERLDSLHYGRLPPNEPGYGWYCYAHDPMSIDTDIGVCLAKAKATLQIKLNNTDPFLRPVLEAKSDETDDEEGFSEREYQEASSETASVTVAPTIVEKKPSFIIYVRMLVTRKLIFSYNGESKRFDLRIVDAKF